MPNVNTPTVLATQAGTCWQIETNTASLNVGGSLYDANILPGATPVAGTSQVAPGPGNLLKVIQPGALGPQVPCPFRFKAGLVYVPPLDQASSFFIGP